MCPIAQFTARRESIALTPAIGAIRTRQLAKDRLVSTLRRGQYPIVLVADCADCSQHLEKSALSQLRCLLKIHESKG